jgi:4-hydroxythreonine-4-phosphate dehydrogenase
LAKALKPRIVISMGDPSGIGPEIILRALSSKSLARKAQFTIVGAQNILEAVARRFAIDTSCFSDNAAVITAARVPTSLAAKGKASAAGGAAAVAFIKEAVKLIQAGDADALVTAPINKYALALAGEKWPGHTELLGALTDAKPVMLMAGGGLRVALVTTHCALRELPRLITRNKVLQIITIIAHDMQRSFGISNPRIAVCGLNPHAGESGRFGNEEKRSIEPAIAAARALGINCTGPVPADVVFQQMLNRQYDAIVAMYHDQATIPVKTLAFESGVNVTLGLPIIRTSPDHGTAYDIAPRGQANARSMAAAMTMAIDMIRKRKGITGF